jgi:dipeptidyl aminopeptidase/acylaminoacyl peptidase
LSCAHCDRRRVRFSRAFASTAGVRYDALVAVAGGPGGPRLAAVTLDRTRGRIVRRYAVSVGRSLSWSRDGRNVAAVTAGSNVDNQLVILDLDTGRDRVLADARRRASAGFFGVATWSPNGDVIAVTHGIGLIGAKIELLDARTGKVRRSFAVAARLESRVSWTLDGHALVFAWARTLKRAPRLRRLDISNGRTTPAARSAGLDPAVGRQGTLAFAAADGIHILSGDHEAHLAASLPGDRAPVWLPSGRTLLVERPSGNCPRSYTPNVCTHVLLIPVGTGPVRRLLQHPARSPATR